MKTDAASHTLLVGITACGRGQLSACALAAASGALGASTASASASASAASAGAAAVCAIGPQLCHGTRQN